MRRPLQSGMALLLALAALAGSGCVGAGSEPNTLRLGYFPNLTHAQALYGLQSGMFEDALAPEFELKARHFNAGPEAFEALLTGRIDVIYVGPSPTLNALASGGDIVRIISGSASGGARFIVQDGLVLDDDSDFAGKTFGSPQLGNTQDVSLKHYLLDRGHRTVDQGGSVRVVNYGNADLLALFIQGDIDGAWLPEPWATRAEQEGGGREFLDEASLWPDGQFVTTHLVTTRSYLTTHGEIVRRLMQAHVDATLAVQEQSPQALDTINDAIEEATGKRIGDALLATAMQRVDFTYDPVADSFYQFGEMALDLELLRKRPPAPEVVYELDLLNEALSDRALDPVPAP